MPRPSDQDDVLLVEVTRGGLVESNHRGALAVVDSEGGLLAAAGNPHYVAYLRSAAKPFQALPTVAAGALDHFGLDQEALALMCASHHGTEAHVAIDQRILDAIGLDKSALRCGVHWPIDEVATRRLAQAGLEEFLRDLARRRVVRAEVERARRGLGRQVGAAGVAVGIGVAAARIRTGLAEAGLLPAAPRTAARRGVVAGV